MAYQTLTQEHLTWTDITNPTVNDIARLGKAYPAFHPLDLEDCLSRIERPKIDAYDDYLFIVMHFPIWDEGRNISRASEVNFFIGVGYLVTIHDGTLKPLTTLFDQCQNNPQSCPELVGRGAGRLLHTAIDRLVDYIFPILYKVDANILQIEESLFDDDSQHIIQEISLIRRDIIALRRIIRPQMPVIQNLELVDRPFIREDLDIYFGDILDHLQKASDLVNEHAEIIVSLADTNDALATYRINEIMRILTVISVIMLPLTLLSGILGMNVAFPFMDGFKTFWEVIGMMVLISFGMLIYFKYQKWL